MKKIVLVMAVLGLMLTACPNNTRRSMETVEEIIKETAVVENELSDGILIAYLSADNGSMNDMGAIAYIIQEVTGGVVMNIDGKNNYPEDYGTIFLGVDGNQSQMPEKLRQFLESNDLSGKTIIPFYMDKGEEQETIAGDIYELEPEAEFLDGFLLDQTGMDELELEEEIDRWLSGLGYNRQ